MTPPPPSPPVAPPAGSLRGPDGGLSPWWPTPARAGDHFAAEELERSARLHRPLRRIRAGLTLAKIGALVGVAWLLGLDAVADRLDGTPVTIRALLGATAVVVAVRLPEPIAGRLIGRLDGVESVGSARPRTVAGRTAAVLASVVVPIGALTVAARLLLGPLTDRRWGWLVALAGAMVVIGATTVATVLRGRRAAEAEVPVEWADLVGRSAVDGPVRFGLLADAGSPPVPNAGAHGAGGRRWILIDPSLLAPAGSLPASAGTFVVAHELTHLARRHPLVQSLLNGAAVLVALAAVPALAPSGWPWAPLGLEVADPEALPVAALVIGTGAVAARVPVAWLLRALERIADAGAVALVGPPARGSARDLHLLAGADLDPPWWRRLLDVRPSPAQRLEYLSRCRRSAYAGAVASVSSATFGTSAELG